MRRRDGLPRRASDARRFRGRPGVAHGVRAVLSIPRRVGLRRDDAALRPTVPPIEEIAADLRRLLCQHDAVARRDEASGGRLRALEVRISIRVDQAATAIEVPHPTLPVYGGLETAQLRRLLRLLAAEGFVLPTGVALLTSDSLS